MATVYPELDERLIEFVLKQPMFFVATAPCLDESGEGGHVNISPKGYRDTFAIIDPLTVAYLDLTGSGAETIAHLRQNGRITIMFCSFDRQPKILRIYGTGRVILPDDPAWPELATRFPEGELDGDPALAEALAMEHGIDRGNRRAIIVVTADRTPAATRSPSWSSPRNATCSPAGPNAAPPTNWPTTASSTTPTASTASPPSASRRGRRRTRGGRRRPGPGSSCTRSDRLRRTRCSGRCCSSARRTS